MNINLKKYDDLILVQKHDLFIDRKGNFYKIKKTREKSNVNHNIWALEYLKNIGDDNKYDGLSPSEIMIHKYGFIYYSHDVLLYKPIVKIPNPKYFHERATEEQLDNLFDIMLINGENPYIVPMLNGEENIYDYVENFDTRYIEAGEEEYGKNLH